MEKDLISIIIPVYNVEKYLKNCLTMLLCLCKIGIVKGHILTQI